MSDQAFESIPQLEALAAQRRRRLEANLAQVSVGMRPSSLFKKAMHSAELRAKSALGDFAESAKGNALGIIAGIAALAGSFELGRFTVSKNGERSDGQQKSHRGEELSRTPLAKQAPQPASSLLKSGLLAALGVGGGYIASAALKDTALDKRFGLQFSDDFKMKARKFVEDQRPQIISAALSRSGVSGYASMVMLALSVLASLTAASDKKPDLAGS